MKTFLNNIQLKKEKKFMKMILKVRIIEEVLRMFRYKAKFFPKSCFRIKGRCLVLINLHYS